MGGSSEGKGRVWMGGICTVGVRKAAPTTGLGGGNGERCGVQSASVAAASSSAAYRLPALQHAGSPVSAASLSTDEGKPAAAGQGTHPQRRRRRQQRSGPAAARFKQRRSVAGAVASTPDSSSMYVDGQLSTAVGPGS